MTINLQAIRYYTANSPYHYTSDNEPLQDLEQNDIALKAGIEAVSQTIQTQTAVGDWSTLQLSFDLQRELNKAFAYRVKIWGIKDQTALSGQVSCIMEDAIVGWNANPGNVNVQASNNIFKHNIGAGTMTVGYSGSANNLVLSFGGFIGANGYVIAKIERFGL